MLNRPSDLDERQGLTAPPDAGSPVRSAVAPAGVRIMGVQFSTAVVAAAATTAMVGVGFALGFAIDPRTEDPAPWDRVSAVVGWLYFNAWAVSFLPQLYLNFVRKCVIGQSFDYVFMNVLGFFCYSIYTISFYFVTSVRDEYKARYGNSHNVDPNDVGFAVYAFLCCVYNSFQIYHYDRGGQVVSRYVVVGIVVAVAVMVLWAIIFACGVHTEYVFNGLDILYGLSVVKLGVSLIKYIPQVYLNYKRKCTVGWNIWNVLLDFTGGSLSVTQQLIDCATTGHWNGIAGNPVKFCLGSLSMVYDIIFMVQHFWLYRHNNAKLHAEHLVVEASRKESMQSNVSFHSLPDQEVV